MTALRLPRPAALATVLLLLIVAIVAFPGQIHSQVGGRVLNPNGVKPTASSVLVTIKGPDGETTRPVVGGRFTFPDLPRGTRVTLQAMAQGLLSAPVAATAPDTMVLLVLRSTSAGQKFTVAPQGAQTRARPAATAAAATPAADTQAEAHGQGQAQGQGKAQPAATPQGRPAGNAGASAQGLYVQEALFTSEELVDRAPVSTSGCTAAACSTRYADTVGTVIFWTKLAGGAPGRWVEHVWFHGEQEIARVRQKVDGATWRTWSRKTILPEWTGDWRVEVRAEDGTLLAERFFTIEAQ
jgi:hypothetical protein